MSTGGSPVLGGPCIGCRMALTPLELRPLPLTALGWRGPCREPQGWAHVLA